MKTDAEIWVDHDPAGLEEDALSVVLLVREDDPANALLLWPALPATRSAGLAG